MPHLKKAHCYVFSCVSHIYFGNYQWLGCLYFVYAAYQKPTSPAFPFPSTFPFPKHHMTKPVSAIRILGFTAALLAYSKLTIAPSLLHLTVGAFNTIVTFSFSLRPGRILWHEALIERSCTTCVNLSTEDDLS